MLDGLPPAKTDSLMDLTQLLLADPRPDPLDLGVGTYRDDTGAVAIMDVVKAAERRLVEAQRSKGYLGPAGDAEFGVRLQNALFPDLSADRDGRISRIQAPGGAGALRLALEMVAAANPNATVWVGVPSWPAHLPLVDATGLQARTYAHLGENGDANEAALVGALDQAAVGDVIILHGCCHNPTGVDLEPALWRHIARASRRKGLLPLVDLAYPGLGDGHEADAAGTRTLLTECENALVAVSCSKTFGLYRDRAGLLVMLSGSRAAAANLARVAAAHARLLWSNPPDHGAAVVRVILSSAELSEAWRARLDAMRARLQAVRALVAGASLGSLDLSPIGRQRGMYALLPICEAEVRFLREAHGIYVDVSGRINLAGLNSLNLQRFVGAMEEVGARRAS